MDGLNHRARKVLNAVVQEYLATGAAVGSRTITRRHGVDISPATVRNVMSDLEEAGLLSQPHTSAGRVPTTQGLRFFVDSLLKVRKLTSIEREDLKHRYHLGNAEDFDGALREASRVLSDLSRFTVVVSTPRLGTEVLEHLEFVRLPSSQLLAVLMTKSGKVQNKLLALDGPVSSEELERIHNFVQGRLGGRTLEQVRDIVQSELLSDQARYDLMQKRALELSRQALSVRDDDGGVIVEGQARLLEQEAINVEQMRALFRALEEKRTIANLLEKTEQADGLQVFIGAETHIDELSDFAVVAAAYGPEERPLGTLGVIGPTWMNYSKVISLVDFTAELVSNAIARR